MTNEMPLADSRILLAEDDDLLAPNLLRVLRRAGRQVDHAKDGLTAIQLALVHKYDVIVSDIMMPGAGGIELLRAVRDRDLEVPVLLMTGAPDIASAAEAVRLGALAYLSKPFANGDLEAAVERALRLHAVACTKREALEVLQHQGPLAGDRAGLSATLDRALERLTVAYQPIVRAGDGSVFGYEALMRSVEPALPHPGAILEAGERLGRLHDVGRRVRAAAAEPIGRAHGSAVFFVNLHPQDLADDALISEACPLLAYASRVIFEITERAALDDVPDASVRVRALRERGYRIAIDDLGAGYAGLASFVQLEPDIVKIDMSLVRDVHTSATKRKVVASLTGLCKDMGLLVVAEGIETAEERAALVDVGCDLLQGYYFARPGPAFPEVRV